MKPSRFVLYCIFYLAITTAVAQRKYAIHTVAFYNFENLFDAKNDPNTNDDEWTPNGLQHWTTAKYEQKLQNLAKVLSEIGTPENPNAPTLIAAAEIENHSVLENLIQQPKLIDKGYGIVHFDSPDKRGIDVALLYQKKAFTPTSYTNIPLYLYRKETQTQTNGKSTVGNRIYTRDLLLVTGFLEGEELHLIINHWPSRSGGEKKTSALREAAAALNKKTIDSLQHINPNAKIILLGDFNDSPSSKSIKSGLGTKAKKETVGVLGIFNPFEELAKKGFGTIAFRDTWDIFDQIMVSQSLLKTDYASFQYWKAGIYNKSFLIQTAGAYKGYPLRHSDSEVGFSDHFPVYIYLLKEKK